MAFSVGIWQVNTEDEAWLAATNALRLEALEGAVDAFWKKIAATANLCNKVAAGLFVAPEYLFVHEEIGPGGKHRFERHHLDASEAKGVTDELWRLSQTYPRLILIPGSILQRRRITGGDLPELEVAKHRHFVKRNLKGGAQTLELGQLKTAAEALGKARYIGKNRALVFLDGLQHIYDKVTDVSEAWDPDSTLHIGGNSLGFFSVEGVRFGLELCKDHYAACLASALQQQKADLQVVLSAHLDSAYVAKSKVAPLLVHACSLEQHSGTYGGVGVIAKPKVELVKVGDLENSYLHISELGDFPEAN